ncbi:hypothetical protein TNIN_348051 [Trichonephila inaurata madagascariensis]|uniref:Uncharacterized protein n=1 Tax=Trichonephila inaurata madagascariensis TaxID=2747483 RepID=A0A8X7BX81_9ARAC|nr:hypothetical protein TNIN_348051 [Trichonephila inaurata madagascariensis]
MKEILPLIIDEAGIVVGRQSFNYAQQMYNQRVKIDVVHWNRRKVGKLGKHCCKRKTKSMRKKKDCCMVLESPVNR